MTESLMSHTKPEHDQIKFLNLTNLIQHCIQSDDFYCDWCENYKHHENTETEKDPCYCQLQHYQ